MTGSLIYHICRRAEWDAAAARFFHTFTASCR